MKAFLPLILAALPWVIPGIIAMAAAWTIGKLRSNANTAPLAGAIPVAEEAIDAAVKALPGGPKAALSAAEGVVVKDKDQLVAAAKAEIDVLTNTPETSAVTDGGSTVNLPKIGA